MLLYRGTSLEEQRHHDDNVPLGFERNGIFHWLGQCVRDSSCDLLIYPVLFSIYIYVSSRVFYGRGSSFSQAPELSRDPGRTRIPVGKLRHAALFDHHFRFSNPPVVATGYLFIGVTTTLSALTATQGRGLDSSGLHMHWPWCTFCDDSLLP